jgi:hypothetical protein
MKGQPVVILDWAFSPNSTRQYPPGVVGYRMDSPSPLFEDDEAVVEFDYREDPYSVILFHEAILLSTSAFEAL